MIASKFLKLAKEKGACSNGLKWLEDWIKQHPKSSISGFFRSQIHCDNYHHRYLMWVWFYMVDYPTKTDLKYDGEKYRATPAQLTWLNNFYTKNLVTFKKLHTLHVPTRKLALALAKEFRGTR